MFNINIQFIFLLSLLATFLRLFSLSLFLGHYSRILLNLFQHLFELFHYLLINSFNFIIIYFLVDNLHVFYFPPCH